MDEQTNEPWPVAVEAIAYALALDLERMHEAGDLIVERVRFAARWQTPPTREDVTAALAWLRGYIVGSGVHGTSSGA